VKVINSRNVNDAYAQGVEAFAHAIRVGNIEPEVTRAGNAYVWPCPVTTVYDSPQECVLWDAIRDCNPFFHFFEALWMLAGRDDVEFLSQFSKRITEFSKAHGAYGYRWRNWFGIDQLLMVIKELTENPVSRRAMVQIWSAEDDLCAPVVDVPCNTMIKFEIRNGSLNMIVFNRSNDMLFGAYGANAVHFSFLHMYMAASIGVPVGRYYQISSNFHVYKEVFDQKVPVGWKEEDDPYLDGRVKTIKLFNERNVVSTLNDIKYTLENLPVSPMTGADPICWMATDLYYSWHLWKTMYKESAIEHLVKCIARSGPIDWLIACHRWMDRRIK
jgi:thymidylate synthase